MQTVSVLVAVYRPNLEYLRKQLHSIDGQSYGSVKVWICDDSADDAVFGEVSSLVAAALPRREYRLIRNEHNLGSNKTFECLTQQADGAYFAYCDQDDIWQPDKIEKLMARMKQERSRFCYSDLSVMDGEDRPVADSLRNLRKRIVHVSGPGQSAFLLRRNSVTGCTMMAEAALAREALPFPDCFVHDHWMALWAAAHGPLSYVPEPLVRYRIHGANQIGSGKLTDVHSKTDYINNRMLVEGIKLQTVRERLPDDGDIRRDITAARRRLDRRLNYFRRPNPATLTAMMGTAFHDPRLFFFEALLGAGEGLSRRVLAFFKKTRY